MARSKLFNAAAGLLIAAAGWAVYGRAVHAPFVFDDSSSIVNNPSITRLWPLLGDSQRGGPLNATKNFPTAGRPLANLSLAINYYFGQLDPAGYHVFNLMVHVLSAWLLMAIVRRTLQLDYFQGRFQRVSGVLAFFAALLWLLHPLQTETVIYITQRTELLVGFFYLATMYSSLRYWTAGSAAGRCVWLTIATSACLAGVASKEVMVTAPVVVLLYERTFIAASFRRALRNSWPLYSGLFISWGLLLYLNYTGPRSSTGGFHLGLPALVWWYSQAKVLLMYLKLAVWPWPLAIHYEIPYLTSLGAAWPWLLPVALLGVALLVLLFRRNVIGFVGAWVLLILSPTLVVPITTEIAAERRMYLPLAALAALFVVGGYWLVRRALPVRVLAAVMRMPSRKLSDILTGAALIIVASVLGIVSVHRLAAYRTVLTLWEDNLMHQPDDPWGHNMLGNALMRAGRTEQAIGHYALSLQLKPHDAGTQVNLGIALASIGRPGEALQHYQQALQLDPDFLDAWANLALAYAALNHPPEAIATANKALQLARARNDTFLTDKLKRG